MVFYKYSRKMYLVGKKAIGKLIKFLLCSSQRQQCFPNFFIQYIQRFVINIYKHFD